MPRTHDGLFVRWLLLVYLPLGLLLVGLILAVARVLPGWALTFLVVLAAWSFVAIWLIRQRRRVGLAVPPPRSLVVGVASVAALALAGGVLAWFGLAKASSSTGVILLFLGGFLMLLAVFAPAFKLVDMGLRGASRLISRLPGRGG